jgi:hypothetical protein
MFQRKVADVPRPGSCIEDIAAGYETVDFLSVGPIIQVRVSLPA